MPRFFVDEATLAAASRAAMLRYVQRTHGERLTDAQTVDLLWRSVVLVALERIADGAQPLDPPWLHNADFP